jgi:hypothetical protein
MNPLLVRPPRHQWLSRASRVAALVKMAMNLRQAANGFGWGE